MSLQYKVYFFALLFSLFFFPHAVHGRHRTFGHHNQHVHRQADIPAVDNLLSASLGLGQSSDPGGNSTPATTGPTTTTTPSSLDSPDAFSVLSSGSSSSPSQTSNSPSPPTSSPSSPPSTSDSPSTSPPSTSDSSSTSPPSTSNSPSTSPPTSDSTPTSSPAITSPQSSQPSSSPTVTCPLGVDVFGQCILPTTSSGSPPASSASTDVPSTSVPSSQPQTPTSLTSSSNIPPYLPPLLSNTPTSSPPLSSNTPASSPPSSSSDTPISLPLSPSIPVSLPPSSSNTPISSPPLSASSPALTDSSSGNQPSSVSPTPSSPTPIDPCGPVGWVLGLCTTSSGTPISASIPSPGSAQQFSTSNPSSPTSQPFLPSSIGSYSQSPPLSAPSSSNQGASSSSGPPLSLPSTPSSSQGGSTSITGSFSQFASGTAAESSTTSSGTNSGSLTTPSSRPVISFPTDTTSSGEQTASVQSTSSSPPASYPPNSQFSYVTITSLLGISSQSSSIPPTLTNPDAPTTTFSLPGTSNSATSLPTSALLPANLPARIYPPGQSSDDSPSGSVLCSILFSNFLPWDFVAQNTQSQGQIFAWIPFIIAQALNIPPTDTPAFALQVFVPSAYQGPADADDLLTEYLFYLQSDLVPELANQIKVESSPFYSIGEPYKELADQVDPAFALTSVPNPNAVPGSPSTASSRGNKSRTDTIIGVVSALGGLALIILGILIFNGVKRSRQLRHLRLSDPNLPNDPYPDRTGRDFDQDSVGGPRRRSFYFAEDSLRGESHTVEQSTVSMAQAQTQYAVQPESQIQYIPRTSPENIRERRAPVVPGAISAPILTQSSLNW